MTKKKLGRIIIYALATSPIWVINWSMFPSGWGRMPLVFALIFVLALLALLEKRKTASEAGAGALVKYALGFYLTAYAIVSFLGADWRMSLWGEQSRQDGLFVLLNFALFAFIAPRFLEEKKHWLNFFRALVLSAVLPAAVAILETIFPTVREFFGEAVIATRFSAWIGNPIFLGGYLAMAVFIGLIWFSMAQKRERVFVSLAIAVCAIGVVMTGSRGPMLGLLAGAIVSVFALAFSGGKRKFRIAGIVGALLLALVFGAGILASTGSGLPGPAGRILDARKYFATNVPRLISWNIAWRGFKERPIFGFGPQNFRLVFDRYYEPTLLKYSFYETVSDKPHNLALEILSTGGLVLFIAWALLLGVSAIVAVGAVRCKNMPPLAGAGALGLIAAYLGHTVFLFDTELTAILLFGFLAWLFSNADLPERNRLTSFANSIRRHAPSVPGTFFSAVKIFALVLLLAADICVAGFGLAASAAAVRAGDPNSLTDQTIWKKNFDRALWLHNPFAEELRKYVAFEYIRWESSGELPAAFVKSTVSELREAIERSCRDKPKDFMSAFVLGQLYAIEGEYNESPEILTKAVQAFRAASLLSPRRQAVPMQLAKVLILGGKNAEAVSLLRSVVSEDDTVSEPHWYLGLALAASNQESEAAAEIAKSVSLGRGPRNNQETLYIIDIFAKAERYVDIVPLYKSLTVAESKNANWHARLAATYAKLGNSGAAIAEAQKAAELDPAFGAEAEAFIKGLK
jgi:O-antigen ligase/tetratricopeptide (TPR) repeat protein